MFRNCILVWVWIFLIAGSAQAGTWLDNFNDGNYSGWTIYNHQKIVERWTVINGELEGEIFQPSSMSIILTGRSTWHDYEVKCKLKFVKSNKQEIDSSQAGISIHDREAEESRYLFVVSPIGLFVFKETSGLWGGLRMPSLGVQTGVWYNISASINGGYLVFIVNDIKYDVTDGDPIKAGKIGLVVSNAIARFDDVSIKGDNITSNYLTVGEKDKLPVVWSKLKSSR